MFGIRSTIVWPRYKYLFGFNLLTGYFNRVRFGEHYKTFRCRSNTYYVLLNKISLVKVQRVFFAVFFVSRRFGYLQFERDIYITIFSTPTMLRRRVCRHLVITTTTTTQRQNVIAVVEMARRSLAVRQRRYRRGRVSSLCRGVPGEASAAGASVMFKGWCGGRGNAAAAVLGTRRCRTVARAAFTARTFSPSTLDTRRQYRIVGRTDCVSVPVLNIRASVRRSIVVVGF